MEDRWLDFYRIYKIEEALKAHDAFSSLRLKYAFKQLEGKNFDIIDLCSAMGLDSFQIQRISLYYYSNL